MAVNREWKCVFHDHEFESFEEVPSCPFGCGPNNVVLEFRTAPAYKRNSTKITDALQRQLASDYNMTDMRGDKDGTSVMSNTRIESGGARRVADSGKPYWNPGMFPVEPGWARAGAKPDGTVDPHAVPVFKPPSTMACAATPIKQIQQGAANYLKAATRFVAPKKA